MSTLIFKRGSEETKRDRPPVKLDWEENLRNLLPKNCTDFDNTENVAADLWINMIVYIGAKMHWTF